MDPNQLNQHMQQTVQLHQSGNLKEAIKRYKMALKHFPKQSDILNLLGTAYSQNGDYKQGLKHIQQALDIQPNHPHYLCNKGETLVRAEKLDEAKLMFLSLIQQQPTLAVAHFNLANILKKQELYEMAVDHYQRAIHYQPNKSEYHYNLGNALQAMGNYRSALRAYEKCLELNPGKADAHNNRALMQVEWEDFEGALKSYQQALAIDPNFMPTHQNLFQFYDQRNQIQEARKLLTKMRRIQPNNPHLRLKELALFPIINPDQEETLKQIEQFRQGIQSINKEDLHLDKLQSNNLSFPSIITYYGLDDRQLREEYAALFEHLFNFQPPRYNHREPHLGFLVTHKHEGVFLKCMTGLIRELSRHFRLSVVCSRPNGKKIIEKHLPDVNFIELSSELLKSAKVIQSAEVDLLYYWEVGTDSVNYFLPSLKPAPLQVGTWGWPVTSGLKSMDYYLSCQHLEIENPQQNYTEKLYLLPRIPVFYYEPDIPAEPFDYIKYQLNPDGNYYLCAQNLRKIQPAQDRLFNSILEKDSNGHILLLGDKSSAITDSLKDRLAQSMGDFFSRVTILPRLPEDEYLALVKSVPVILDSLHYTGGANTNYDAFAAGTPVVTLSSKFHRGRYTTAAYQQMGFTELVTETSEAYVNLALKLVRDPDYRQQVSQEILSRKSELFEDQQAITAFTEHVYDLFKTI